MNTLIGYVLFMTLMFSLAAGFYFGLKTFCEPDAPWSHFPEMGGKGAQNRHLVPILLTIWTNHMRKEKEFAK